MSELPMRGHFRYLRFKNFPMTPRTPQCEVFSPLLSSSENSGVLWDSQPPTFPSVGLHPHTWPKWGCDICCFVMGPTFGFIEEFKGTSNVLTWIGMNFQNYFMPCHGMFFIYSFAMWKIFCDMVKYSMTWQNILWLAIKKFATSHVWFVWGSIMACWF